jgi:hypothetical protein
MIELDGNESRDTVAALRRAARHGGEQILLLRPALLRLLDRHQAGEVTAAELAALADELEANEEVDFEEGAERLIGSVLFHLSTPELNGDLTADKVRVLRAALDSGDAAALATGAGHEQAADR